jgi:ribosomal protein S18 acetylase RimI-like enzyme
LRAADAGDVDAVLALWALARSAHAAVADRREDVERLLAAAPGALIVALEGGELAGAVIAASDGWRGNIYRLAVHPARRRRGVGRLLVAAGEERLRAMGIRRVSALVAHEDSDAVAFWDALGYPLDGGIGRRVRNL